MTSVLETLAGPASPRPQLSPTGVQVIPYNASFDKDSSSFLPWFWSRLKEDGLLGLYYPGQEECGFSNFVKLMSGGAQILLVTAKDTEGRPDKLIGFVSVEPMQFGSAQTGIAGFIFLKEFWDKKYSTDAANAVMEYWFTQTPMDIAIGVVSSENHLANRFLARLGWKRVGDIPLLHMYQNKQTPATFWNITKSDWENQCRQQ